MEAHRALFSFSGVVIFHACSSPDGLSGPCASQSFSLESCGIYRCTPSICWLPEQCSRSNEEHVGAGTLTRAALTDETVSRRIQIRGQNVRAMPQSRGALSGNVMLVTASGSVLSYHHAPTWRSHERALDPSLSFYLSLLPDSLRTGGGQFVPRLS